MAAPRPGERGGTNQLTLEFSHDDVDEKGAFAFEADVMDSNNHIRRAQVLVTAEPPIHTWAGQYNGGIPSASFSVTRSVCRVRETQWERRSREWRELVQNQTTARRRALTDHQRRGLLQTTCEISAVLPENCPDDQDFTSLFFVGGGCEDNGDCEASLGQTCVVRTGQDPCCIQSETVNEVAEPDSCAGRALLAILERKATEAFLVAQRVTTIAQAKLAVEAAQSAEMLRQSNDALALAQFEQSVFAQQAEDQTTSLGIIEGKFNASLLQLEELERRLQSAEDRREQLTGGVTDALAEAEGHLAALINTNAEFYASFTAWLSALRLQQDWLSSEIILQQSVVDSNLDTAKSYLRELTDLDQDPFVRRSLVQLAYSMMDLAGSLRLVAFTEGGRRPQPTIGQTASNRVSFYRATLVYVTEVDALLPVSPYVLARDEDADMRVITDAYDPNNPPPLGSALAINNHYANYLSSGLLPNQGVGSLSTENYWLHGRTLRMYCDPDALLRLKADWYTIRDIMLLVGPSGCSPPFDGLGTPLAIPPGGVKCECWATVTRERCGLDPAQVAVFREIISDDLLTGQESIYDIKWPDDSGFICSAGAPADPWFQTIPHDFTSPGPADPAVNPGPSSSYTNLQHIQTFTTSRELNVELGHVCEVKRGYQMPPAFDPDLMPDVTEIFLNTNLMEEQFDPEDPFAIRKLGPWVRLNQTTPEHCSTQFRDMAVESKDFGLTLPHYLYTTMQQAVDLLFRVVNIDYELQLGGNLPIDVYTELHPFHLNPPPFDANNSEMTFAADRTKSHLGRVSECRSITVPMVSKFLEPVRTINQLSVNQRVTVRVSVPPGPDDPPLTPPLVLEQVETRVRRFPDPLSQVPPSWTFVGFLDRLKNAECIVGLGFDDPPYVSAPFAVPCFVYNTHAGEVPMDTDARLREFKYSYVMFRPDDSTAGEIELFKTSRPAGTHRVVRLPCDLAVTNPVAPGFCTPITLANPNQTPAPSRWRRQNQQRTRFHPEFMGDSLSDVLVKLEPYLGANASALMVHEADVRCSVEDIDRLNHTQPLGDVCRFLQEHLLVRPPGGFFLDSAFTFQSSPRRWKVQVDVVLPAANLTRTLLPDLFCPAPTQAKLVRMPGTAGVELRARNHLNQAVTWTLTTRASDDDPLVIFDDPSVATVLLDFTDPLVLALEAQKFHTAEHGCRGRFEIRVPALTQVQVPFPNGVCDFLHARLAVPSTLEVCREWEVNSITEWVQSINSRDVGAGDARVYASFLELAPGTGVNGSLVSAQTPFDPHISEVFDQQQREFSVQIGAYMRVLGTSYDDTLDVLLEAEQVRINNSAAANALIDLGLNATVEYLALLDGAAARSAERSRKLVDIATWNEDQHALTYKGLEQFEQRIQALRDSVARAREGRLQTEALVANNSAQLAILAGQFEVRLNASRVALVELEELSAAATAIASQFSGIDAMEIIQVEEAVLLGGDRTTEIRSVIVSTLNPPFWDSFRDGFEEGFIDAVEDARDLALEVIVFIARSVIDFALDVIDGVFPDLFDTLIVIGVVVAVVGGVALTLGCVL